MTTRNTLLALLLMLIGFCVSVGISAYETRVRAQMILKGFQEVGRSKNPSATFEVLRQRNGNRLLMLGCNQQLCQYEMSVSNRSIAKLHLVPYTEMNVWFTLHEGTLQVAMLEYRAALPRSSSPVVHIQQDICARCGASFDVNPHGTSPQMWNGFVELDSLATPQQRDGAFALNLKCLTRIRGCRDIVDLLPAVWAHTGPGLISSRLVGLSQILEESHGFPTPTTVEHW
jgi:hypothetical protein